MNWVIKFYTSNCSFHTKKLIIKFIQLFINYYLFIDINFVKFNFVAFSTEFCSKWSIFSKPSTADCCLNWIKHASDVEKLFEFFRSSIFDGVQIECSNLINRKHLFVDFSMLKNPLASSDQKPVHYHAKHMALAQALYLNWA